MTKVIVVTGGIGSGKSAVVARFDEYFPTINADKIVDDAYLDASLAPCQEVANMFGQDIIEDGKINKLILREKLKTAVDYKKIGNIWSDYVRQELQKFTDEHPDNSYVVWEVPLAIESGWTGDILIAVVAPLDMRVARVMERSKLSYKDVVLRMSTQATIEQTIEQAAHIICNNSNIHQLHHRVDVLANGLIDIHYG